MRLLKQIWNYKLSPGKNTVRIKAAQGLVFFFAFMIGCTLISRAADSLTVPVVEITTPKRMALTHTLELDGVLEFTGKIPVLGPENALVTSVAVKQGDQVQAGDLLLRYDIEEIQQSISEKSFALTKLELELDEIEQNEKYTREKNQTALNRAFDDYEAQAESASFRVKTARDEMNRARHDLRVWEREGEQDSGNMYESLQNAYLEKKRLYEQAQLEESQALNQANRGIEDAIPGTYTREKERKQTEIEEAQIELAHLKKKIASGGALHAPAAGTVMRLSAEPGKRLGGEAAAYLSGNGIAFTAPLTQMQKEELAKGGEFIIDLGEGKKLKNIPVQVVPIAEKTGSYQLEAELPEGEPGAAATAQAIRKTEVFPICVPLSAVNGQNPSAFLLVVRERETPLGMEQYAERVDVVIEESDISYAAISGAINSDDQIIVGSLFLSDGDRIRVGIS